jgi:DNA-binding NtrC family response regulator
MTGNERVGLVKSSFLPRPSIMVILLHCARYCDSAVDALRLGAFDYLQKPYDREKLLETISRALKN